MQKQVFISLFCLIAEEEPRDYLKALSFQSLGLPDHQPGEYLTLVGGLDRFHGGKDTDRILRLD